MGTLVLAVAMVVSACGGASSSNSGGKPATSASTQGSQGAASGGAKYPSRPVQMIVPWGPGGGSDVMGRTLAKGMSKALSQNVPVQDIPGGTGTVGLAQLLSQPADGYQIGILTGDTVARVVQGNAPWNMGQATGVCRAMSVPTLFFVRSSDKTVGTWAKLAAYAKAHPGKLKVGTPGYGDTEDMTIKYLASKGYDFTEVAYAKPAKRTAALLGGHVDGLFEPAGDVQQYLQDGKFKAILAFSTQPVNGLASVPTSYSVGIDVALPFFRGVIARAGTPAADIARLASACKTATATIPTKFETKKPFMGAKAFDSFLKGYAKTMKTFEKKYLKKK